MAKLFLLRHIKSQWNKENRFTGWMDIPLDKNEIKKAKALAKKIFKNKIDKIYSSALFRNEDTIAEMMENLPKKYPIFIHIDQGKMKGRENFKDISENDIPVFVTERLNERYYGELQGENKKSAAKKFGKEKVHLWRRSYTIAPPGGESLKEVFERTVPFYKEYIENDLRSGQNVLLVASGNTLRSIVKYLDSISDDKIIDFEIPYGGLLEYEFGRSLKLVSKKSY